MSATKERRGVLRLIPIRTHGVVLPPYYSCRTRTPRAHVRRVEEIEFIGSARGDMHLDAGRQKRGTFDWDWASLTVHRAL